MRRLAAAGTALILIGMLGRTAARAEDAPASPPSTPAPSTEPNWYTPPDGGACRQWSDGCHVCIRADADAKAECSTPAIACVQTQSRCLDPAPPEQ